MPRRFLGSITSTVGGIARGALDFFGSPAYHGIFSNDGRTELLPGIGVLSIEINQEKTIASHPLENNAYRQDNIITEPTTITMRIAAEKADIETTNNTLSQLYKSTTQLVSIMADNRLYPNMVLSSLPIIRTPDKFDLLEIDLGFHEFIFAYSRESSMSDPNNVALSKYSDRQRDGLRRGSMISGADAVRIRGRMTVPPGGR